MGTSEGSGASNKGGGALRWIGEIIPRRSQAVPPGRVHHHQGRRLCQPERCAITAREVDEVGHPSGLRIPALSQNTFSSTTST